MLDAVFLPPKRLVTVNDAGLGDVNLTVPASACVLEGGRVTMAVSPAMLRTGRLVPTMTDVDETQDLDITQFQTRDFELSGRDFVNASAIVKIASRASMIWGTPIDRPKLVVPCRVSMPYSTVDRGSTTINISGQVDHVKPSDVPANALRPDIDLYGRDLLIYEALARASTALANTPVLSVDALSAVADPIGIAWSQAESSSVPADISAILRMDVDVFKKPDSVLAYRDNTLAVFAARLIRWLKDPLAYAERLNVRIQLSESDVVMSPEVYVRDTTLEVNEFEDYRVWVAEPRLEGRFMIVYDPRLHVVHWVPPTGLFHTPRIQPFSLSLDTFSGPGSLVVKIITAIPERKDAAFYADKASQVVLDPVEYTNNLSVSGALASGIGQEGLVKDVFVSGLGTATFSSLPIVLSGHVQLGMVVIPSTYLEVLGCQLTIEPAEEDDDGENPTWGDFNVNGGIASVAITMSPGNYQLEVVYTNRLGSPDQFPIDISLGGTTVTSSPFKFGVEGYEIGDEVTVAFNVHCDGTRQDLVIQWSPEGSGSQLSIKRVRLKSGIVGRTHVELEVKIYDGANLLGTSMVSLDGYSQRPDIVFVDYPSIAGVTEPSFLVRTVASSGFASLIINQVQVRTVTSATLTPNAAGLEAYRDNMLNRAVASVRDSFRVMAPSLIDPRVAVDGHSTWSPVSTSSWMSHILRQEPRLFQAFRRGGSLDVGRPALIPTGLERVQTASHGSGLDVGTVLAHAEPINCFPVCSILQPWMVPLEFWVAVENFW